MLKVPSRVSAIAVTILALLTGGAILVLSDELSSFDCTGTLGSSSLREYGLYCNPVMHLSSPHFSLGLLNRLDLVKTCTCNLLDKSLAWDSLLTHEIESMYHAVKSTALSMKSKDSEQIGKTAIMNDRDRDNKAYIWDLLSGIVAEHPAKTDGVALSRVFEESLSKVYYDLDQMVFTYEGDPDSTPMRIMILTSCRGIFDNFDPFKVYFENMAKLAGNSRYIYRLMESYPTLYKLMVVSRMCNYLLEAEEFIE